MSKLSLRMSRADLKDIKELHNAASSSNGNGGGSNSNSNSPLSATQSSELVAPEAADAHHDDGAPPPSYVPSVPASEDGHNDAASKEISASPKKSPPATASKGKKDKESKRKHGHSHSHSHTKSGHEDRDCVVM